MTYRIFTLKTRERGGTTLVRGALLMLTAVVVLAVATQTACSKRVRIPIEEPGPVRVVVLPFAVSPGVTGGNRELQWTAMAAPALIVRASRRLPDINVVPFSEVMPVAISEARAARSFTDDSAAAIANWLSAQWTIMGEIRRRGSSYEVVVDFIPARATTVPYRHIKTRRMENIGTTFYQGLVSWFRYVTSQPTPLLQISEPGLQTMRALGEALDKEYGWFATAEPGAAQAIIDEMLNEDEDWINLIFSPTMYPSLAKLSSVDY